MLIPTWAPFNIYEMSAWSRTIVVPLSILWAFKPVRKLPAGARHPRTVPQPAGRPARDDAEIRAARRHEPADANRLALRSSAASIWRLKFVDRWRLSPLRRLAVRRAERWMCERFARSDGLGAIFPPIIWSVVALKCLGHGDDSPAVKTGARRARQAHDRGRRGDPFATVQVARVGHGHRHAGTAGSGRFGRSSGNPQVGPLAALQGDPSARRLGRIETNVPNRAAGASSSTTSSIPTRTTRAWC